MRQVANTTARCWLALQMCRAWVRLGEFYPMYIARGDDALPPSRRFPAEKSLVVPHPHHLAENPPPPRPLRVAGARFRVGLIGTVRKEKPIRHLLEILLQARGKLDFQLVVGTPRATTPPWLETLDLEVQDTTTEAQYSACLSSLDIFVVDFVQAEYFFRPSGAVIDAGMNGCYVICPDYLVFQAQISDPVSIGRTFQTVEEIPRLLKEAMQQLALGPIDTATWRRYHRAENIAARMRAFLEQRATRRALPAYRKAVAK
jgi:glycosyltransferase involved in cell wall biosynthesis